MSPRLVIAKTAHLPIWGIGEFVEPTYSTENGQLPGESCSRVASTAQMRIKLIPQAAAINDLLMKRKPRISVPYEAQKFSELDFLFGVRLFTEQLSLPGL
jgi:hypothetical protein